MAASLPSLFSRQLAGKERGVAFCFAFLLQARRQTLHSTGGEGGSVSKDYVTPLGFSPCEDLSEEGQRERISVAHSPWASLGAKTSPTLNIPQNYELSLFSYLAAVAKC